MKRELISFVILSMCYLSGYTKEPLQGYRGFIEWDNTFGRSNYYSESNSILDRIFYTGIATSHGYQFNHNIFLGTGIDFTIGYPGSMLPAFIDFRYDLLFGKFTPFGDVRLGYNMTAGGGIYFSPSIGYRFNWGRKVSLNIGIGYTLLGHTNEKNEYGHSDENSKPEDSYFIITSTSKKYITNSLFSIRMGCDF